MIELRRMRVSEDVAVARRFLPYPSARGRWMELGRVQRERAKRRLRVLRTGTFDLGPLLGPQRNLALTHGFMADPAGV